MKLLPAIAISAAAFSSAAWAADLPTRKEAPPPAPVIQPFSWSGIYVGGYAGGAIGRANMLDIPFPGFVNGNLFDPIGFTGGGLVGGNYQFNSFVIGAEGEFGYDGARKSQTFMSGRPPFPTLDESFESTWVARGRGRVGYAINNFLMFAAGGVSFTDGRLDFNNPFVANGTNVATKTFTGFNIGGGVEYAFTQNWIVRGEYIFDDFGHETYPFKTSPAGFDARRISFDENTVRAALEYKFW